MGKRETYLPGVFCWVELSSADSQGAAAFYSSLLGWSFDDANFEWGSYRTARVDGSAVAGVYDGGEGPCAWACYVKVDDVDACVKQGEALGARILSEPVDVGEMGRMAFLADPTGAAFGLWQPFDMTGAELVNDPGAFSLTQLNTADPQAAQQFYGELFSWRFERQPGDTPYWGIFVNDALNAGMMANPADGPDYWLTYFTTAVPLEQAVERVADGGGTVVTGITQIGEGRIIVAQDPQGAFFALFEGRTDD